jgi:hypothetical protein
MRALLPCILFVAACVVSGTGAIGVEVVTTPVVYTAPPAAQHEPAENRPGYVHVHGRWDYQNGRWVWLAGHYEPIREGRTWRQGRWEARGNSWQWVPGGWDATTGPR